MSMEWLEPLVRERGWIKPAIPFSAPVAGEVGRLGEAMFETGAIGLGLQVKGINKKAKAKRSLRD